MTVRNPYSPYEIGLAFFILFILMMLAAFLAGILFSKSYIQVPDCPAPVKVQIAEEFCSLAVQAGLLRRCTVLNTQQPEGGKEYGRLAEYANGFNR